MTHIIDAKKIAGDILDQVADGVGAFKSRHSVAPDLAVV